MKIKNRQLVIGGGLLTAVLLALFAWWIWPELMGTKPSPIVVARGAPKPIAKRSDDAPIPQFKEPTDVLERLGIDPKATPHCAIINQWHDRGVPMWSMLKNVDAQAMFFNEEELACLTASPLPPGILDTAEQRVRRPNAPGARNFGGQPSPPGGG